MRRLLLSVGLAVLVGGIAVAANADQPFGEEATLHETATGRAPADLPRAISDLPIVDQATPGPPATDGRGVKQPGPRLAPACRPEEMLVKFKPGADATAVAARHGASIVSSIPQIEVYVLAVPTGTQTQALAALAADPDVEYAEPNAVVRVPELQTTPDPCSGTPIPE